MARLAAASSSATFPHRSSRPTSAAPPTTITGREIRRLLERPREQPARSARRAPRTTASAHRIAEYPHAARVRSAVEAAGNYHSGDDYVVEFLGYASPSAPSTSRSASRRRRSGSGSSPAPSWTTTRPPTSSSSSSATRSRAAQRARRVPRRHWDALALVARRVARLLAEEARLPRRVARPPRQGGPARGRLGRRAARTSRTPTRTAAARCSSSSPRRAGTSSSTGR